MMSLVSEIVRSLKVTLLLVLLLCGAYPAAVWIVGNALFHDQASGGLIERDGKIVGARLIGQAFTRPEFFHGRPSAAGEKGYDAANSSGSNLGPTNRKLVDRIGTDIAVILRDNPGVAKGQVPVDLVTTSGSGLDPDISPEAARLQIPRVAKARGMPEDQLRALVDRHTKGPQWGLFGEPVVNVLALNLELGGK